MLFDLSEMFSSLYQHTSVVQSKKAVKECFCRLIELSIGDYLGAINFIPSCHDIVNRSMNGGYYFFATTYTNKMTPPFF
jgi:hypothetical protein